MANLIANKGKWQFPTGSANTGGITPKSYPNAKYVILDFDNSEATSIMYTDLVKTPFSTESTIIFNSEGVNCADTADMTISWQGTADPDIAAVGNSNGADIAASDTGWQTVAVSDLTGSAAMDAVTVVNLSGVANVVNMPYMRFKFELETANPGDVDIKCWLTGLPQLGTTTSDTAI